jgi:hypothetical protein
MDGFWSGVERGVTCGGEVSEALAEVGGGVGVEVVCPRRVVIAVEHARIPISGGAAGVWQ